MLTFYLKIARRISRRGVSEERIAEGKRAQEVEHFVFGLRVLSATHDPGPRKNRQGIGQ